jgi:hypothetical protein
MLHCSASPPDLLPEFSIFARSFRELLQTYREIDRETQNDNELNHTALALGIGVLNAIIDRADLFKDSIEQLKEDMALDQVEASSNSDSSA